MATWVEIENGVVRHVYVPAEPYTPPADTDKLEYVDVTNDDPTPQRGWLYDGQDFTDPTPEPYVPTLQEVKDGAKQVIDVVAEAARLRYITGGAGQAMTYQEKGNEAADYIAASYPAMGSPPEYPFVHADSLAFGITHQEAADQIVAQKAAWVAVGSQIEEIRLGGKKAVDNAVDETGVNTARDNAVTQLDAL